MADRKEYFKKYVRDKDNKKKHAEVVNRSYHTVEGRAYVQKKERYPKSRFTRAKRVAVRRKKTWTIEFSDYLNLVTQPCYYCREDTSSESGCGLDRKDNDRGYELDNVVPCCKVCNRIRSKSMSSEEFLRQTILNGRRKND